MCNPFDLWNLFVERWGSTLETLFGALGIVLPDWFPLQLW